MDPQGWTTKDSRVTATQRGLLRKKKKEAHTLTDQQVHRSLMTQRLSAAG